MVAGHPSGHPVADGDGLGGGRHPIAVGDTDDAGRSFDSDHATGNRSGFSNLGE
jgi:hypothetical protein